MFTLNIVVLNINLKQISYDTDYNSDRMDIQMDDIRSQQLTSDNTYSGIGDPWNVTHWANRTDTNLASTINEGSYDLVELPLETGWEGYRLDANIKNLYDERNWNNGTFDFGTPLDGLIIGDNDSASTIISNNQFQNWTFHSVDVGVTPNTMSGNYLGTVGDGYFELYMRNSTAYYPTGTNWYQHYDNGDKAMWNSSISIDRGILLDCTIKFDAQVNQTVQAPAFFIEVFINNVRVYAISPYEIEDTYGSGWVTINASMNLWINQSNVFTNSLNSTGDIPVSIGLKSVGANMGMGITEGAFQSVYIDDFEIITKAEVKPDQIGLVLNGTSVNSVDWGLGELDLTPSSNKWQSFNNKAYLNFSSTDTGILGTYNLDLNMDSIFYASKNAYETTYETILSSLGNSFSVENNSFVNWQCFDSIQVPSGYVEEVLEIKFPEDLDITGVYDPQFPSINIISQCDISTRGTLLVPIINISSTPDGFWKFEAESPNYCEDLNFYVNGGSWVKNDTVMAGETLNIRANITTSNAYVDISSYIDQTSAQLQIRFPNGSIWTAQNQWLSPDSQGLVNFTSFTIPDTQSPYYIAGEYEAIVTWNNTYSSNDINETGVIYKKFTVVHDSVLTADQNQYFFDDIYEDSIINLKVSFNDNISNDPITDAKVYTYKLPFPSGAMQNFSEISPGFYFLEYNVSNANLGNNTLTINANSSNYVNQEINITVYVVRKTTLTALEYPSIKIPWNDNFTIHLNYSEESSGTGVDTTPVHDWSGEAFIYEMAPGRFNITCNTSLYAVNQLHSLNIDVNKIGYETQSIEIKIELIEREAFIDDIYLNSINKTVDKYFNLTSQELLNITVRYEDSATGNNIKNAFVQLTGTAITKNFTENLIFDYYNLTINSTDLGIGVSFLTVTAQLENYTTISEVLTISILERNTYSDLFLNEINKTQDRMITLTVNQTLNITVTFKDNLTDNHIPGATVELTGGGLDVNLTEDIIQEQHYILINTTDLEQGVNFLNVYAQKQGYEPQSILIAVEIIERETKLALFFNGTDETLDRSEKIVIGEKLNITITYRDNQTGAHISGADVSIQGGSVNFNLTDDPVMKQYWIWLNSTDLDWGVNYLTIYAYKANYEPQTIIIKIEVINKATRIDTFLDNVNKTAEIDKSIKIQWNEIINITVMYKDNTTGVFLDTATINITGPGIDDVLIENGPLQQYTILINTTDLGVGIKFLTITAQKTNYKTQTVLIEVEVVERVSKIKDVFLNNVSISFIEIAWNETLNITATYKDNSTGNHIDSATVDLNGTIYSSNMAENITLQQYSVVLNTIDLGVGINYLTITAQKNGYELKSFLIIIQVIDRQTKFQIFLNGDNKTSLPEIDLTIGDTLNITVNYIDFLTDINIDNATLKLSGENLTKSLTENVSLKYYSIILNTTDLKIGVKFLTLLASKGNYSEISEVLRITIRRITTEIRTESGSDVINIKPGGIVILRIELWDLNNSVNIKGVIVNFTWELGEGVLSDADNDGIYEAILENIPCQVSPCKYTITITVYAGDNYEFERKNVIINVVQPAEDVLLFQIIIIISIAASIALGSYLIAYQQVLKYPKPVRKVRSFRKNIKKEKSSEKVEILDRLEAFNTLYIEELGIIAKSVKEITEEQKSMIKGMEKSKVIDKYKSLEDKVIEDENIEEKSVEEKSMEGGEEPE
jgi:hypothetical protein